MRVQIATASVGEAEGEAAALIEAGEVEEGEAASRRMTIGSMVPGRERRVIKRA